MSESYDDLISSNLLKSISDKNEEKRHSARAELKCIAFQLAERSNLEGIQNIIHLFANKFIKASDINQKIVGLEVMLTLIRSLHPFPDVLVALDVQIVSIILRCLNNNEPKIRCQAIRTVLQITHILKQKSIRLFNLIFERIISCINDGEDAVREQCSILNEALHNVLIASLLNKANFDLCEFVKILKLKLKTLNLEVRIFLIEWIKKIIVKLDLIVYLPDFLEDLLILISIKELKEEVSECLTIFQTELRQKFHDGSLQRQVSVGCVNDVVSILIRVAKGKYSSYTKLQVLEWFKIIFIFFKEQAENKELRMHQHLYFKNIIIERFDEVLEPILLLMSHEEEEVRRESINANDILMESIRKIESEQPINFIKVVPILKQVLSEKKSTDTSEYAINWMKFMLENYNDKIISQIKEIVEKLIQKIYESNLKNVTDILKNTTLKEEYFELIIEKMLSYLFHHFKENEEKIYFMMIKFIGLKDSFQFCSKVCSQIQTYCKDSPFDEKLKQKNHRFCFEIAANLNYIIINEASMITIRKTLNKWDAPGFVELFTMLFNCLKLNPPALLSLCFLSQQYELAFRIINTLIGKYEISSVVLMGLCKLVSLLQKSAFLHLRLQILEQRDHFLLESLNSLLMILPQGKIFNMLRNRLDSACLISKKAKMHEMAFCKVSNPIQIGTFFECYLSTYGLSF